MSFLYWLTSLLYQTTTFSRKKVLGYSTLFHCRTNNMAGQKGGKVVLFLLNLSLSKTNKFFTNWKRKNIHNWTSQLSCIWHIFRKLGYFWLFLRAPVLFLSPDAACTGAVKKTHKSQFSKKKGAKCVLTLMSNYEIDFWWWIHILHFKYEVWMRFAYIVTAQWCVFNNSSLIGIKICQILTHKTKL